MWYSCIVHSESWTTAVGGHLCRLGQLYWPLKRDWLLFGGNYKRKFHLVWLLKKVWLPFRSLLFACFIEVEVHLGRSNTRICTGILHIPIWFSTSHSWLRCISQFNPEPYSSSYYKALFTLNTVGMSRWTLQFSDFKLVKSYGEVSVPLTVQNSLLFGFFPP